MQNTKIKKVQKTLDSKTAYLAILPSELFYLTGIAISGYYLLITKTDVVFLSSRMTQYQLKDMFGGAQIISAISLDKAYREALKKLNLKKVYFSPSISLATYNSIKKSVLCVENELLSRLRMLKSADEISIIRENQKITSRAIFYVKKLLKAGLTEKFIQSKILRFFLDNGASPAFEPIVAFGKNSAYPHHVSTTTRLGKNDVVLIDAGCRRNGYASDLTKTFFLGTITPRAKAVYNIVRESQKKAIDAVADGKTCSAIDSVARDYIKKFGFRKNFIHGVGHGLGLEVHEKPTLSQNSQDKLSEGMIITIEPGVYIPGEFGVRIEDVVLVTKNGCEVLTK